MIDRLLVVGLGSIGRRHARLARAALPNADITVLRHRDCSGADEPAINRCVTTIDDALRLRPQAAVIANPATHHLAVALRLVDAGVHLLIEKPLAGSSRGVEELIALARTRGTIVMTGYNLRFLPTLRAFREVLASRRVGRVLSVRAAVGQYLPGWRPAVDYRTTVSARAALGGGVLLELSHEIDYLRWLFGEVAWVKATLSRQSAFEIDVEDCAHLVLGFVSAGDATPVIATLDVDFIRHDTTRICTVIGETGSLRWDAVAGQVDVFDAGGTAWQTLYQHTPERDESYIAEWQHFLACIPAGPPPVSAEDGLAVLRIVDAARESSTAGVVVRLDAHDTYQTPS